MYKQKIREFQIENIDVVADGYLIRGSMSCGKAYKFLVKGASVLMETEEGWKSLSHRMAEIINYKFMQSCAGNFFSINYGGKR